MEVINENLAREAKINRKWAMPNKNTFTIKPIKELLTKYIKTGLTIIDPFANNCKIGTITNDLNPEYDTDYHLDALKFLKLQKSQSADIVLYDPPYSITQASECYNGYGKDKLEICVSNMKYWAECKNEIARIVKPNGIIISCGWNTNGLGKGRNFELLEILIVAHGGSKNDTLVTVERSVPLQAGYRKQTETVKEFAEKVIDVIFSHSGIAQDCSKVLASPEILQDEINDLAEQYGKEE